MIPNHQFFFNNGKVTPETFIVATGGTVTTDGNYKIHTLDIGDSFQITSAPAGATFEIEMYGGGGGGGAFGGGGAGGRYYNSVYPAAVQSYSVTVGAGGAGTAISLLNHGTKGGDTIFDGHTAQGGGYGGGFSNTEMDGGVGGCGGGAGCKVGPTFAGGTGGIGDDFNGGNGDPSGNAVTGGGGGGAVANGTNGSGLPGTGGNGGDGIQTFIRGTSEYFAGGGGGAGNSAIGGGGVGGAVEIGGSGARGIGNIAAKDGQTFACGGGGSYAGNVRAGNGYKGIIIIRYQYQAFDESYLLIVGGQSNGTDRFTISGNLPANQQVQQLNLWTYYKPVDNSSDNGDWAFARAGYNTHAGASNGFFAVTIPMARKLNDTYNKRAFVLPTAVGGSYIANDEIGWYPTHVAEYYDRMLDYYYTPSLPKLPSYMAGKQPILIWIHGESDSDTLAHGQGYEAALTLLISQFRTDVGFPNAKVIITALRADYAGPPILGLADVIQAQINIAAADPNVYYIDTNGATTTLSSDGQHYNPVTASYGGTQSAINLGYLIADLLTTF